MPELETVQPVPVMVIVPAEGLKLAPELTVNAPVMLKLLAVATVAEEAMVRLENVRVPELTMDEPLFMVMVPLVGVNVPVTVKIPFTVAELPAPVIEPLTFRLPYVRLDNTSPVPA